MIAAAPPAFARARDLVTPGLQAATERLSEGIRRVVVYHLGWVEPDGSPATREGGKSVRPALAYVCAEAVGAEAEAATPGAVAVELVHNFSLLHDDVMDEDTERRHRPTAWALFGVGEAILAGDALLTLAHEILIDPPSDVRLRASGALSEATAAMITGQAQDLAFETRDVVGVEECLAMLDNKTAALIACACRVGAILGGADDKTVRALGEFGRHLGLAYQAIDDVLGIWGKTEQTGKPQWSDLRQRKKSLPVTAAMDAGGVAATTLRSLLALEEMSESDLAKAAACVEEGGGREAALHVAGDQLAEAIMWLGKTSIPPAPRKDLEEIAGFITTRDA